MEQSPSWEANWLQLIKKIPAFYGTRRFITELTSARHLSLSWARPLQSTHPHLTSRRSVLILSSHLRLGLPSGLLPSAFPTKTLYAPPLSPIRATCPAHLILNEISLAAENMCYFYVISHCIVFFLIYIFMTWRGQHWPKHVVNIINNLHLVVFGRTYTSIFCTTLHFTSQQV
jgi:hypothetical protein